MGQDRGGRWRWRSGGRVVGVQDLEGAVLTSLARGLLGGGTVLGGPFLGRHLLLLGGAAQARGLFGLGQHGLEAAQARGTLASRVLHMISSSVGLMDRVSAYP